MISTVRYFKNSTKMNVSETLRETAIAMTEKKGSFHVKDILFALECQGVTSITEKQAQSLLSYNGASYKKGERAPRVFHTLEKLHAGWFVWKKWQYNPQADEEKGEMVLAVIG